MLPHLSKLLWGGSNDANGNDANMRAVAQQTLHNNSMDHQVFQHNRNTVVCDEITAQLNHQVRLSRSPSLTSWIDRTAFSNIVDFVDDATPTANSAEYHVNDAFHCSDLSQLMFVQQQDPTNMFVDDVNHHMSNVVDQQSKHNSHNDWRYQNDVELRNTVSQLQQQQKNTLNNAVLGNALDEDSLQTKLLQDFGRNLRYSNTTSDVLVPVPSIFNVENVEAIGRQIAMLHEDNSLRRQSSSDTAIPSMLCQRQPSFSDGEFHLRIRQ